MLNGVHPSLRYMQRAKLADLFLDTPLVNAHTSATDVLWAGVPMISLARNTMISRVAASILVADRLQHLIARNLEVVPNTPTLLLFSHVVWSITCCTCSFCRTTSAWPPPSRGLMARGVLASPHLTL